MRMRAMDLKIRYARPDDFEFVMGGRREIARVEKEPIWDIGKEKKKIKEAVAGKRIRIACSGPKALGFLWFARGRTAPFGLDYGDFGEELYWVDYVFVEEGEREKGIGAALYKDLEELARRKGVGRIMLDVYEVNGPSRIFHEGLGFAPFLTIYSKRIANARR